jgi:hypothetical protein
MHSFIDLYEYLKNYNLSLHSFLSEKWEGKDKQESVFRLFAYMGLIPEFINYSICDGNFNKGSIRPNSNKKILFQSSLKDKGDKSDLSLMNEELSELIITTSKNLDKYGVGDLDIRDILAIYHEHYSKTFTMRLCIVVRDVHELLSKCATAETSNKSLVNVIRNSIIIDWNDLEKYYYYFKQNLMSLDHHMNVNKKSFINEFHQIISRNKIRKLFESEKDILLGCIPRSGKSYIMGGECIPPGNYLIITPAPNETIPQYIDMFNSYIEFGNKEVIHLTGDNFKIEPKCTTNNIIICSKQFLEDRIKGNKIIKWLQKMSFDIRFFDEAHLGGSTDIAKEILRLYGKHELVERTKTMFITATYNKPILNYGIPEKAHVLWDLEDISLCKSLNFQRLLEKHKFDPELLKVFDADYFRKTYSKYPDLHMLNLQFDKETKDILLNIDGEFSIESLMMLKHNEEEVLSEFKQPEKVLQMAHSIFGKYTQHKNIVKKSKLECGNKSIFDQIEKVVLNPMMLNKVQMSRWFCKEKPLTIMCFLPCGTSKMPISKVSKAFRDLLLSNNVLPDMDILSLNSSDETSAESAKILIDEAEIKVKNTGKKGLLVLSGRKCSLGVTLKLCDIVLLLNNNESYDLLFQMLYRAMTPDDGKRYAFVVDFNIQRTCSIITEYALSLKLPNKTILESIRYVLEQNLISLQGDYWLNSGLTLENEPAMKIYNSWLSTRASVHKLLDNLNIEIELSDEETKNLRALFRTSHIKSRTTSSEIVCKKEDSDIGKGIIRTSAKPKEEVEDQYNIHFIQDILRHIIPLICFLTIHIRVNNNLSELLQYIISDTRLKNILLGQLRIWWDSEHLLEYIVVINDKYLRENNNLLYIMTSLKDLLNHAISESNGYNRRQQLSQLIDQYLVPQQIERQKNAEISTPFSLRKEMLDAFVRVNPDFFKFPHTVLEPCCGKGGFVIDIIDRFMEGLKESIPDDSQRYRLIIEKCIYIAEQNPTNTFIIRTLLDPTGIYKLNLYEGDTLSLDPKHLWNLDKFDAVIGNPPYTTSQEKHSRVSTPLYHLFISKFIDTSRCLLFVIPSRWFITGKGLDQFRRNMLSRSDIQFIQHEDNSKSWFGSDVDIKGGCCYFLKNSNYNGPCLFNNIFYDLSKYDIIIKPEYHPIIQHITNQESIKSIFKGRYFNIETNDDRIKDAGEVKCFVSTLKSKDRIKYLESFEFNEENRFWKIITPTAAHKHYSGFGELFIGTPNEVHSSSYVCFKVKSENEAKSLLSYLKSKVVNLLLSIRKVSQTISESTILWIPLVPLDREWDDITICEYLCIDSKLFDDIST